MKKAKRIIPAFTSEAEEAEWWHTHRKTHDKLFDAALKRGEVQVLTPAKLRQQIQDSKAKTQVISLRIPGADLELARVQAAQKGLPYQTYIKSLLHETLVEREKR